MSSKKQRCLRMERLPHDVVELIMERLPAKSLLRFRAVSRQWKSTVGDPYFQERQLKHRQESGDPDVLMVSVCPQDVVNPDIESLRTLVLGSSSSVKIPTPWENTLLFVAPHGSCDGLVCLYNPHSSGFVVNPTTRWHRPLPPCQLQQLMMARIAAKGFFNSDLGHSIFKPGFGKDKITGIYKPVWLYNSSEIGLENATTCEVFDFTTNSWRYVTPAAPYRIDGCHEPVYVDGSLHWFTECEETKIISFDLQTEAFQVLSKAPFVNVHPERPYKIVMCNLENRLCVSEMKWPNQVIWSFNPDNKTWDKIWSIDREATSSWFGTDHPIRCALSPLALFDGEKMKNKKKKKKKKKKLLLHGREGSRSLVIQNLETQSYDAAYSAQSVGHPVCYYQSLISIL